MKLLKSISVNVCRLLLAVTFIVSGFVKAIDPLGTQYKIQDYMAAWNMESALPDFITLGISIGLSTLEFTLGVMLLFAIRRRQSSRLSVIFLLFMTIITAWLYFTDAVKDCGCFGDFIHLTNGQTLLKDIVLLAAAVVVALMPMQMVRFISRFNQWIVINYSLLFIIIVSVICLWDLPMFDFRPYHIGSNIKKGMEIPKGEKEPKLETTFILEKNGEQKEFTLDDYPDSTWTFIDSKTKVIEPGYEPPIHDFSIELLDINNKNVNKNDAESDSLETDNNDITDQVLSDKGYTFLFISPWLEKAEDKDFGLINQIYEYCKNNGYAFYCLTSSSEKAIQRWIDITGAEYPFAMTDGTTLKTVIRSNPGLLLLKNGMVIRKWSHNNLPDDKMLNSKLESSDFGKLPADETGSKLLRITLLFFLPLAFLTLLDRMWAGIKWLWKRRTNKQ